MAPRFNLFVALMAIFSVGLIAGCSADSKSDMQSLDTINLLVGTYKPEGSDGVYRLAINTQTGEFGEPTKIIASVDPSFMAKSAKGIVYVGERVEQQGMLSSYVKKKDGSVALLATSPTLGASPCYVAFNADQSFIATANYSGSNTSIFAVDESGQQSDTPIIVEHEGRGVTARQEAPHPHWVKWSPNQPNWLYVVDLGIDEIKRYTFDEQSRKVTEVVTAHTAKPGAGPRQMVFHPNGVHVYVLNELDNTLFVGKLQKDGSIESQQLISTLPESFTEHSQASHIVLTSDAKTLYTSNRGHNSIARFSVAKDGNVKLEDLTSTQGNWPRFFTVLEEHGLFVVANRITHDLFSYKIANDGSLTPTGFSATVNAASFVEPIDF